MPVKKKTTARKTTTAKKPVARKKTTAKKPVAKKKTFGRGPLKEMGRKNPAPKIQIKDLFGGSGPDNVKVTAGVTKKRGQSAQGKEYIEMEKAAKKKAETARAAKAMGLKPGGKGQKALETPSVEVRYGYHIKPKDSARDILKGKKTTAKKTTAKKTTAKKTTARKTTAKKTTARKTTARKTTRKKY